MINLASYLYSDTNNTVIQKAFKTTCWPIRSNGYPADDDRMHR